MRHRYPFEALHWLRHERVDRQATLVSESAARTAQARSEEARAEAARLRYEQAIEELSTEELSRLGDGQLRAGDLQLVGDWRKGADTELEAKSEREQRAREARQHEAAAEVAARRVLGSASNEAKMIDTHRQDWQAERAADRERGDDEEAAEQWTASRFPSRRS